MLDCATPAPNRARNSRNTLAASPDTVAMTANTSPAIPAIRPRRNRSASQPIGSAPTMRKPEDAPEMNTITPLLT